MSDDTTATDAFHAVVAAATQINGLVESETSAGDVFQQVTSAVHAAAAIQTTLRGASFPDEPAFEPNKTPTDVYRVLLECYEQMRLLAASREIALVELRVSDADARYASLQDVSELAVLLSAEMRFALASWSGAPRALDAFDPGLKFPSHVHQRARFLLAILRDANTRAR